MSTLDNEVLKNYIDNIDNHLSTALNLAIQLQTAVQNTEADGELLRKMTAYLTPNLNHWVNGMQAGNIKDLRQVLAKRLAEQSKNAVK